MASEKISQLTPITPALSADIIPIDRAGVNYSLTAQAIANLASSGGASFTTAGQGYFWGAGIVIDYSLLPMSEVNVAYTPPVTYFTQFVLQAGFTIRKVTYCVGSPGSNSSGCNLVAGLYDSTGAKVLDTGAFPGVGTGTNNGVLSTTNTLGSPVVLAFGVYYLAWAIDTLPPAGVVRGAALNTTGIDNSQNIVGFNRSVVRYGTAANHLSGTTMPSTLGALTGYTAGVSPVPATPAVLFEV